MWRTTVLVLLCRHPTDFSQFKSVIQIGDLSLWYPIHRYSRPDLIALHSHGNDSIAVSRGHFGEKSRLLWAAGGGSAFLEPIATFRGLRWPSNCPGLYYVQVVTVVEERSPERVSSGRVRQGRSGRPFNCAIALVCCVWGSMAAVWVCGQTRRRRREQ